MRQPAFEACWGSSAPRAVTVLTLFSTDLLGPYCYHHVQHLLWSFSCFLILRMVTDWEDFNTYVKEEKSKMGFVHVCNFPSGTERFMPSLPGRFLGTNYICSHWTPSPDYRGLKWVLSSPLHPSDCQNPWKNHPGALPYSRPGCCLYQSCQGMHCFGLVLHCTAGSGEATVPWIENLLPMSAAAGPLF